MFKSIYLHLSWGVWLIIIYALSLTPGDKLPQIEWELISVSTIAHFGFYFVLSFLQIAAFSESKKKKHKFFLNLSTFTLYSMVISAGILTGYLIELIQEKLIHMRYYDLEDVVINGIGTIFGVFSYAWIGKKLV